MLTQQRQQNITSLSDKHINTLYKSLMFTSLLLFLLYALVPDRHSDQSPPNFTKLRHTLFINHSNANNIIPDPTNISHIVIGVASTVDLWNSRKPYIESWWQPNVTKGYLFLDREPIKYLPWSTSSPPYRVSESTLKYKSYDKHPIKSFIRMVRVIGETFKETCDQGIRWYVVADDDTILFLDNLVDVLQKYDHTKYFYIGHNSESLLSNFDHSFKMAFGGAGYAISYPLAEALTKNMDVCIKRYTYFYGTDQFMHSCIADLGVSLTHEKGFHQIDLHDDLLGFLSSHPQAPVLSLHHLDRVDPLFPGMKHYDAIHHIMRSAKVDQSRFLQQTICYNKDKNWSISIAWGYTAQIYDKFIPPSVLEMPLETFSAWKKPPQHPFMFNTRSLPKKPCDTPHVFFLQSVERNKDKNQIVTSYTLRRARKIPFCSRPTPRGSNSSSHPSDITKIIVVSPATKYPAEVGNRRECCDVLNQVEKNVTTIKYRTCLKNEILGV